MKRRWLGVILTLYSSLSFVLLSAPTASAAPGETFTFTSISTIKAVGGDFTANGVVLTVVPGHENAQDDFKHIYNANTYDEINNVRQENATTFNAVYQYYENGQRQRIENIVILDPKGFGPQNAGDTPDEPEPVYCDAGAGFTWIVCGIIYTLIDVIDWIRDSIIVPFLHQEPLTQTVTNSSGSTVQNPTYTIWAVLRNVASIFFILVFFLIIFGTAIGWDNYTVKKALPRLVAGAVFLPFSWYLCVALIDIGNVIGQGLVALCSSFIPPTSIDFTSSLSKLIFSGLLVAGAIAAFAALATLGLTIITSMAIAFLGVLFTLVLRKILITLLVVLSPFAFLAWILPNTEKWYKEWWTNFFKLVMMYPLIVLLFEAGRLFAATAGAAGDNTITRAVTPFFQLVGLTLPLFLVPLTFSWAGKGLAAGRKAIARTGGAIDKRYGRNSEFAKERAEQRQKNNARKAVDTANNPLGSKTLGAMKRSYHRKRSGLGGFVFNNAAQKMRLNATAKKAEDERTLSKAQDEIRSDLPETSAERITNRTAAEYDKLLDSRADEAGVAVKNDKGVPLDSIPLGDEGIAQLKEMARTGDQGVQLAVLRRLNDSRAGENAIHELRTGEKQLKEDTPLTTDTVATRDLRLADGTEVAAGTRLAAGTVVAGGSFVQENANEEGASAAFNMGEPGWDRRKFDEKNVAPKYQTVWFKGNKKAVSVDSKKSLKSAARDISPDTAAGLSEYETRRYVDYYDRNQDNVDGRESAAQYNAAFQAAVTPRTLLSGRIKPDTVDVIARLPDEGTAGISARSVQMAREWQAARDRGGGDAGGSAPAAP